MVTPEGFVGTFIKKMSEVVQERIHELNCILVYTKSVEKEVGM